MDNYYDTGATAGDMNSFTYIVSAWRKYGFTVQIDLTSGYVHHISKLKTIHNSGYWIKYNSENLGAGNYTIISEGDILAEDIGAELWIYNSKAYLVLKNQLKANNPNFETDPNNSAYPNYLLNAKYRIGVVQYTTANTSAGP
jgi:hypothetical protein